MRLPEIAFVAFLAGSQAPEPLNAAPMGATARTSVQIIASVAPRIQVTDADDPATLESEGQFCIRVNAPVNSFSLIAVDSSGEMRPVAEVSSSSLCQGISGFDGAVLSLARDTTSASAPPTLLIAPE